MADLGTVTSSTVPGVAWFQDVNDAVYKSELTGAYNILLDGVDRTGSVDATSLINTRINALSSVGGGTIVFPAGTYKVLDIVLKSNVNLVGLGGATFEKNGGLDETHIMYGYGTLGTATALTTNCTVNSTSCAVTSASGFTEGGYAVIRTNEYVSGSSGRRQEVIRIIDITGLTITFERPVFDTYNTASSAELVPLTPLENVVIDGFIMRIPEVVGGNVGGHIDLKYGVGCLVQNNKFYGAGGDPATRLITCYRSLVTKNQYYDGQNLSGGGYGYGIEFDEGTALCIATENFSSNIREHTFTNRTKYCHFVDNVCTGHYDTGFNTHGADVSHCLIANNIIAGTINGAGIAVGFGSHGAGDSYIDVLGNTVKNVGASGILANAPNGLENNYVKIANNNIFNYGLSAASQIGVYINQSEYCEVEGNTIRGISNNAANGIYVNSSTNCVVSENTIKNLPNGFGITLDNATNAFVNGNRIYDISSNNVRCLNTNTGSLVVDNFADDTAVSITSEVKQRDNSWNVFIGTATYNPANLLDGAGVTTTVTVTGATLGMQAQASFSLDLQGITLTAYVSSANTVSVRFQNESGGAIDLGSGTITAIVNSSNG